MDEKTLVTDFLVKCTNLCEFLGNEKKEELVSKKLFDTAHELSVAIFSFSNPILSKAEVASLRKSAALKADAFSLDLSALFSLGYISEAQRDSMTNSLSLIKKQMNI